jgi:hypothetical protein
MISDYLNSEKSPGSLRGSRRLKGARQIAPVRSYSTAMELKLRPTIIGGDKIDNDFTVVFDGRSIGRIRQADERIGHNPGWDWVINPPLPVPPWCTVSENSVEQAKAAFREA